MRNKKLAVRFGLLAVLLISLSLASTSNAWPFGQVKPPKHSVVPYWRGGLLVSLSCDTPGATTRWTWASGYKAVAPIPTSSSQLYRGPILVTREGQLKARAFKLGYWPSDILVIDFWYSWRF